MGKTLGSTAHEEVSALVLATRLAAALERARFAGAGETALQDLVEVMLKRRGELYVREFAFTAEDRVDFLVAGSIALEVKVQGGANAVMRQLQRYAQHQVVDTLLLVTSKARLAEMPAMLSGKRIVTAVLRGFP